VGSAGCPTDCFSTSELVMRITGEGRAHHIANGCERLSSFRSDRSKEAAMVRTDYAFVVLLTVALFLVKWEVGHWRH